jgi:uncharacterized membrane protein
VFATLALACAAFYGAADFFGGLASKRADTVAVALVSQLAGLVALALLMPFLPSASPRPTDYLWGAAAGVAGSVGVALLYRALAIGVMSIVAPITAVCAVVVPLVIAVALGERPGMQAVAGIVLAIVAIVLMSRSNRSGRSGPSDRPTGSDRSAVNLALVSGAAVGLFFFFLERTSSDAGLWPLIAGRLTSVPLFGIVALAGGHPVRMERRGVITTIACGELDMLANVFYLLATRYGPLSLVVTLASLYPASTVLLARFTLGERLTSAQAAGVVCAILAVLMIVGSTA